MAGRDQLSVRPARVEDSDAVALLVAQLGYPTNREEVRRRLTRLLEASDVGVLVADRDGEVVGAASFHFFELLYRPRPQCRITALVVGSDHRRGGIGTALVEAVERAAREHGCWRLELTTRPERPEAMPFYTVLGFSERRHRLVKPLHLHPPE